MTIAYTPSGPLLWAWDWCGGRSSAGKAVTMNTAYSHWSARIAG